MLKLTIQLFLEALVIGVVVNLALLYAAEPSTSVNNGKTTSPSKYQSLEQSSTDLNLLDEFGN